MKIITARSGRLLRIECNTQLNSGKDYVRRVFFPETHLDPNEQANWLKDNLGKYDEVYTLSPWIISESETPVVVLDSEKNEFDDEIYFGDSINRITIGLWRNMTVGPIVLEKIEQIRNADNYEDIKSIVRSIGDSVEKVLAINMVITKEKKKQTID